MGSSEVDTDRDTNRVDPKRFLIRVCCPTTDVVCSHRLKATHRLSPMEVIVCADTGVLILDESGRYYYSDDDCWTIMDIPSVLII